MEWSKASQVSEAAIIAAVLLFLMRQGFVGWLFGGTNFNQGYSWNESATPNPLLCDVDVCLTVGSQWCQQTHYKLGPNILGGSA